ncbi:hypothetical protein [Mesorhizobium sp. L-8-3]|uniref:hypothetical protein n=1 Tax=Mesorhizobium sp. L-8-3 TaxID=2744522 RepID=UPI001926F04F|nr:hypothetical protein [Mesorhizobium sp. L-8-3]BCH22446.1 hypothetical protein MesoLjLb_22310 [Mesorhizobium sp. L-8-3]
MTFFLRDILDEKLKRNEADADLFRAVVQYEFASGLNATVEGAAAAMRRWVKARPAWVSDVQQARRLAALAAIEAALSAQAEDAGSSVPAIGTGSGKWRIAEGEPASELRFAQKCDARPTEEGDGAALLVYQSE